MDELEHLSSLISGITLTVIRLIELNLQVLNFQALYIRKRKSLVHRLLALEPPIKKICHLQGSLEEPESSPKKPQAQIVPLIHLSEPQDDWWEKFVSGFTLPEEWLKHFRMTQMTFRILTDELRPYLISSDETAIIKDPAKQMALTLYTLTQNISMMESGLLFGVSQNSVVNIVKKVCKAISLHLGPKYLKWPSDQNEVEELVRCFEREHGFPQCIGAIDNFFIQTRRSNSKFLNSLGFYSLNIQAICDYKYCFMDVMADSPGSVHVAEIFFNSSINKSFMSGNVSSFSRKLIPNTRPVPILLIGDSCYPLMPHLMIEYPLGGSNEKEKHFGSILRKAKEVIRCALYRLKARFRFLGRSADIPITDLPSLIRACFILHNVCEMFGQPIQENSDLRKCEEARKRLNSSHVQVISSAIQEGENIREVLSNYFMGTQGGPMNL
uniref:Nuclease HARBI1 n=2 Tax=Lepeophtheirus salmonis TaxID=72036 RepID=D3PJG4_LEPSM|nr:nuclease HARBI1 [Lepeophtheirus salmonis]